MTKKDVISIIQNITGCDENSAKLVVDKIEIISRVEDIDYPKGRGKLNAWQKITKFDGYEYVLFFSN